MVDIQSETAEIRKGKKTRKKKIETTALQNMSASATQGGHNQGMSNMLCSRQHRLPQRSMCKKTVRMESPQTVTFFVLLALY